MLNVAELRRYGLMAALMVVGYLMVRAWNDDFSQKLPPALTSNSAPTQVAPLPASSSATAVPTVPGVITPAVTPAASSVTTPVNRAAAAAGVAAPLIEVVTDVLQLWIDENGDVVKSALPGYPLALERKDLPTVLLDRNGRRLYIAQSWLTDADGIDAQAGGAPHYRAAATRFELKNGDSALEVPLEYVDTSGVRYAKTYRLRRGDYQVHLDIAIDNRSAVPWRGRLGAQLKRDGAIPEGSETSSFGPQPFLGVAYTTPEKAYEKSTFDKLKANPIKREMNGGWIAILQHYFIVSWIASPGTANHYFGDEAADGTYVAGFTGPLLVVPSNQQARSSLSLYIGPKIQSLLADAALNLDRTVDYGWMWMIAKPLFQMMNALHGIFQNWGLAIIALTILVKLLLYPLSAYSYRSMAQLREVAPEMKRLQERYSGEREKLSREMMDLYKREKVNPLGGCLPMLVQMPVFLSLYWVLYESVELRQAPFLAWIVDLSIKDPFFVLPLLMGGTMYLTQMLSPPMPDPMQARMMKMMPAVFTVMFAFFPAGLVLYWVVNNFLSFAQQWWVTRQVSRARA